MASHLDSLIETIARLRAPDGCPWDREQDHRSLGRYLLEESYEVLEAIHADDPGELKEELGDLLLQIVLHAQIASDEGQYDIQDVASGINAKMVSRHPHVFGESSVATAQDVITQWHELKKKEKAQAKKEPASIVDSVPKALPALLRALKISERAVSEGFEWNNQEEVWAKLDSELAELKEAMTRPASAHNRREIELEFGDVLFCLVNIARWLKFNPEEALILSTEKFCQRYTKMSEIATGSGTPLDKRSKDDLAQLWEQAKESLSSKN